MNMPAEGQSLVGGAWRLSRSQRAFVSALVVVLVPTCLALTYLLLDFRAVNESKERIFAFASRRDTLLLTSYETAVRVYSLAEEAYVSPARLGSLQPIFTETVRSLHGMGTLYVSLTSELPSDERQELLTTFNQLWNRYDTLVSRAEHVFREPANRGPGYLRAVQANPSFWDNPNVQFTLMRRSLDRALRAETQESRKLLERFHADLESTALGGSVIAFLVVALGIALAVFITRRARLGNERRRRYEAMLDASLNPIQVVDHWGHVLYVNPTFERVIGFSLSELIGKSIFEHVRVSGYQATGEELWFKVSERLESGQAWSGDVEIVAKGGEPHHTMLIISPVRTGDGSVLEAVGIHHDITERRELARKFAESQEKYQNIVEGSLDGIVIVQDGKIVFVNASSAKIFGYESPEEMSNLSFLDTVAPSNRFLVLEGYEGKSIGDDVLRNFEMKGLTKQGTVIDLEINAKLVSWNGNSAVQGSFRDITKRKALEREQALWLWEQETMSAIDRQLVSSVNLQSLLDAISYHAKALTRADWAGVMMLDLESKLARWRAVTGNRMPLPLDPIRLSTQQIAMTGSTEHLAIRDVADSFLTDFCFPFEGESIISAARFPLMVDREVRGHLVVAYRRSHDLTPRETRLLTSLAEKSSIALANAQLYESLLSRERELEMLSGARVQAQEEERRRISREIHDSLGQMLTAIKFNVEILEDAAELQSDEERRRVADIKALLDNAMAEAREISYNLMPSVLVDFGLVPALQFLADQFQKRNEFRVQVHTRGVEGRLDSTVEIGLYRIAQEALNNIAKHAEAHEVSIQLVGDQKAIRMIVEDDGKGFQVSRFGSFSGQRRGMGLVSMRERAASFNGLFLLDSRPGQGTEIIVEVPRVEQEDHG